MLNGIYIKLLQRKEIRTQPQQEDFYKFNKPRCSFRFPFVNFLCTKETTTQKNIYVPNNVLKKLYLCF